MTLCTKQQMRHIRHKKWPFDTVGGGGRMIWDNNIEIYIYIYTLLCVKQIASGSLMYDAGSPSQFSVTTLMDGVGREVGRGVQEGKDPCMPIADSCWCMAEAITILQSNYPPININKHIKNKHKLVIGKDEWQINKQWLINDYRYLFWGNGIVLKLYTSSGCTALWMYQKALNCTFLVVLYGMWISLQ